MPIAAALALFTLTHVAIAQEAGARGAAPGVEAVDPDPASLAKDRVDAAIQLYIQGSPGAARDALMLLLSEPELAEHREILAEARVWLGEVQFVLGEHAAAQATFEAALRDDPALRLDPFEHPPEVVTFFDAVRAAQPRPEETPRSSSPAGPSMLVTVAPGGLQLYNGQTRLGAAVIGSVAGMGITCLTMRLWLVSNDDKPGTWGVQVEGDEALGQRLRAVKTAENTIGMAALGVWGVAILQGTVRAEAAEAAPTPVSLLVSPSSVGLVVRW
ncbi:MAG: hypothetical protein IPI35_09230 [Deltaproteobacteria bacterium]|nr:hypothetical protein [Deltaproteobacteria bacterium]